MVKNKKIFTSLAELEQARKDHGKEKKWRDETKDLSFKQAKFSLNQKQLKKPEKSLLCAKILSKQKTPLPDLWKIFYRDQQNQQKGFFYWMIITDREFYLI